MPKTTTLPREKNAHAARRAFLKLTLAALAAGASDGGARAQSIVTTAEPEGPDHLARRRVKALDTEISYVDVGQGDPVVFLHGNPTWSYQWRNIIPFISPHRRCLAPDFVGMGWSGKSPTKSYRYLDQERYLDAWFDALGLTRNVILVGHDWGGPIAFSRARRYRSQIKAVAYMETIMLPRTWADFAGPSAARFKRLRSAEGEKLVMDENFFVEVSMPAGMMRKLSPEEWEGYTAPYRDRERRLPTLVWPRELPIEGEPADVVDSIEKNAAFLRESRDLPKLYIDGVPGGGSEKVREFARSLPNQRNVTVKGLHHAQEDSPKEIGEALREFVLGLAG